MFLASTRTASRGGRADEETNMSSTLAVKNPAASGGGLVAGALRAFRRATGAALARDEAAQGSPVASREPERPAAEVAPAGEPRTLRALGVPGTLATDLESAFRQMGMTRGDRVVGYFFRTPEGDAFPLRLESADGNVDRAA
jgi:hypothetical protein